MISSLRGQLRAKSEDRIVLEVGGVGYEVLLPAFVRRTLDGAAVGQEISLVVLYCVSERQPRPLLIGFTSDFERRFFETFIKVSGIGPTSAAKALALPVSTVARAIEEGDVALLRRLEGVGPRTAEKIVASLRGKVGLFALLQDEAPTPRPAPPSDLEREALEILSQLGYRRAEAQRMLRQALEGKPSPASAEELIQRVYQSGARK